MITKPLIMRWVQKYVQISCVCRLPARPIVREFLCRRDLAHQCRSAIESAFGISASSGGRAAARCSSLRPKSIRHCGSRPSQDSYGVRQPERTARIGSTPHGSVGWLPQIYPQPSPGWLDCPIARSGRDGACRSVLQRAASRVVAPVVDQVVEARVRVHGVLGHRKDQPHCGLRIAMTHTLAR